VLVGELLKYSVLSTGCGYWLRLFVKGSTVSNDPREMEFSCEDVAIAGQSQGNYNSHSSEKG